MIQTFKIINGYDKVESSIWFQLVGDTEAYNTRNGIHAMNIKPSTQEPMYAKKFSQTELPKPGMICQATLKNREVLLSSNPVQTNTLVLTQLMALHGDEENTRFTAKLCCSIATRCSP